MNFEGHLFSSPTADSFDSFYATHAGELDRCRYDEEKNVIVLDGAEYPPETVPNPDCYTGLKRAGAFLFELADPYAGDGLLMTDTILENSGVPLWASAAYTLKALIWSLLSLFFSKRCGVTEAKKQG